MPRPSIISTYTKVLADLSIIERFYRQSKLLPSANMQGFVSEVLMLRAFSILEQAIIDVACRVACGVKYRNGTPAMPICRATSCIDAIQKFKNHNRAAKPLHNLNFSRVKQVGDAVKYVIDLNEPFRRNLNNYGVQIDEMRRVRNHIAHRNRSTRDEYKKVLVNRYGANIKLTPAAFLTSTKRQALAVIEEYLIIIKVIIDDITKG